MEAAEGSRQLQVLVGMKGEEKNRISVFSEMFSLSTSGLQLVSEISPQTKTMI